MEWMPIESKPPIGTVAVLYFPQDASEGFDGLDYRYRLAIYRRTVIGDGWHDQGTNHDSFEGPDMSGNDFATHYLPLRQIAAGHNDPRSLAMEVLQGDA